MFRDKSDGQTKFALQTQQNYRQIYRQNSHDEEVDEVQPVNTMQLSTELDEIIV